MSDATQDRLRALVLAAAPIVLIAGFLVHPYIVNELDTALLAEKASADPDRWAWAHLLLVAAIGLTLVSAVSIRHFLRLAGEQRYSLAAVALLLVGGTLLAAA